MLQKYTFNFFNQIDLYQNKKVTTTQLWNWIKNSTQKSC